MGLDDRLRTAHQQRLADTRRRLAERDHNYDEPLNPSIPLRRSSRVLAIAAALVVVAGGVMAITTPWDDDGSINTELGPADGDAPLDDSAAIGETSLGENSPEQSSIDEASGDEGGDADATDNAADAGTDAANPDNPADAGNPDNPANSDNSASADGTAGTDGDPANPADPGSDGPPATGSDGQPGPDTSVATTAPPTSGASSTRPVTDAGIDSDVCPSGRRAALENAQLRYVGDNQGWSRLDDLVDEQDGPFYFNGWEPGYPDDVTVEVLLAEPALAQDIRIAQDPYTPVSGLIAIGVIGEGFNLEMSGTGGWQVHDFGEPRIIGSFTINRQNPEANVMEVVICLAAS